MSPIEVGSVDFKSFGESTADVPNQTILNVDGACIGELNGKGYLVTGGYVCEAESLYAFNRSKNCCAAVCECTVVCGCFAHGVCNEFRYGCGYAYFTGVDSDIYVVFAGKQSVGCSCDQAKAKYNSHDRGDKCFSVHAFVLLKKIFLMR